MSSSSPGQTLAELLAGAPTAEIQAALDRLGVYERYAVLCRACSLHGQMPPDRSEKIQTVLTRNYPFHFHGRPCESPLVLDHPGLQTIESARS